MQKYVSTTAIAAVLLAAGATTVPAHAATSSLLVTTINRAGNKIHPKVTAHNMSNNHDYTVKPGKRRTLPSGRYAVLTEITTGDAGSTGSITLAGRMVTVKGATSLTLDARKAKPIKTTLDGHNTGNQTAGICVAQWTWDTVVGSQNPGHLFIMGGSDPALHFQYVAASLATGFEVPSAFVSGAAKGIPTKPSYSFKSSSLATLRLAVRKGKVASPDTWLTMVPQGTAGCNFKGSGIVSTDGYSFAAPTTLTLSLSAGNWDTWLSYPGGSIGTLTSGSRTYTAGKSYTLTMSRK